MKKEIILILNVFAFIVFSSTQLNAQTTVSYDQRAAHYTNFSDGGGTYDAGSDQFGMWANFNAKQIVAWRKFKTAGNNTGSDRALQIGDKFTITVSAQRAYGKIGCALLASPSTGSWANRESNYAISVNLDGPAYAPDWGLWYIKYNGGNTATTDFGGVQGTYFDYKFEFTLTAADRMNVVISDNNGHTYSFFDVFLNTSAPITDYSVYLQDDWTGGSNKDVFWKPTTSVANTGSISLGASNSSFTVSSAITNGLDAASTSTVSVNTLTKTGNGILTLGTANTYTGATTVASGVIEVAGNMGSSGTTVQNLASMKVTGDVSLNALTIDNGGAVEVPAGKYITVTGTLTNNAGNTGLVVKSGGSLIENNSVAATVESAVTGNEWHLISAPVSDAMSGMFIGKYLQTHSESSNAFTDILTLTEPLTPMKGFALWGDATGFTASYAGALNSGSTSISLTRSAVGNTHGWNLVGNPYPSSIDWDASAGWTKTNVANATYIHVNNATWAAYVGGSGTNGGSQFIAPCQGFFVYVKDDGSTSGTLAVTNAVRVNNATAFYKNTVSDLARLQVSGNGYTDEAVVRFLAEATAEFDNEFDAHKLFGDVNEAAQIYTSGSVPLAINTLPETGSVPVGIHVGAGGTYTITATEVIDMPVLALEDIQTGIFTDLLSNSYSFNFMPGDPEQRFVLHFGTVSIPETANINANIFSNGRILNVDLRNSSNSNIFIYTIAGQLVASSSSVKGMNTFNLENSGNYIVKVITDQSSMVQKVFIK